MAVDKALLQQTLNTKTRNRCHDESLKALSTYRQFELTQMYTNFYGNDIYHEARKNFVYKMNDSKKTPENIAIHRQNNTLSKMPASGSMYHFIWQDYYKTGDEEVDGQHKDLFLLADQLTSAVSPDALIHASQQMYQHSNSQFRGTYKNQ